MNLLILDAFLCRRYSCFEMYNNNINYNNINYVTIIIHCCIMKEHKILQINETFCLVYNKQIQLILHIIEYEIK